MAGGTSAKSHRVQLRVAENLHHKLTYYSEEKSVSLAEAARLILESALRNQKPPKHLRPRGIEASDVEWERWHALADTLDANLDDLIRKILNKLASRSDKRESQ